MTPEEMEEAIINLQQQVNDLTIGSDGTADNPSGAADKIKIQARTGKTSASDSIRVETNQGPIDILVA